MSKEYTAPTNGHEITVHEDGSMTIKYFLSFKADQLNPGRVQSLREFFRDERDEELCRWRSKLNPEWVGYDNGGDDAVVIHEPTGVVHDIIRGVVFPHSAELRSISEEYFDTHRKPKPWQDAEPGEVWVLTVDGVEFAGDVDDDLEVRFHGQDGYVHIKSLSITAGRKIWPED